MAKRQQQPESSDDETPDAVSFSSSKKAAKGDQDAMQRFHLAEKLRAKEKNRAIDRALKERAKRAKAKGKTKDTDTRTENAKRSKKAEEELSGESSGDSQSEDGEGGSGGRPSGRDLEERMARAMREAEEEAEEESVSEGEASGFEGFGREDVEMDEDEYEEPGADESTGSEDDESGNEDGEEGEESSDDDDDDMGSESEDDGDAKDLHPASKNNYLPDHLFKSALSTVNTKIVFDERSSPQPHNPARPPRKRKRTQPPSKDILLGSRTIRTLSKPSAALSPAAAKGLARSKRVDKFVNTSLNMKGDMAKSKTKGWTRRPAQLGVLKRSGPAASFVRTT